MGTNYYFKVNTPVTNIILYSVKKCKFLGGLSDIIEDKLKIHICKLSYGWKPLFQKTKYYYSFNSMLEFYNDSKKDLTIINEYDKIITLKEFLDIVNSHSENNKLNATYSGCYFCNDGWNWSESEFS